MKKTILLFSVIITLVCAVNLHSQIKERFATKETWEISGSLSLKNIKSVSNGNESDGITYFDLIPYAGYFVADGLELALIPVISLQDFNDYNLTDLTIYFAPSYNLSSRSGIYPYFQGAIGYGNVSGRSITTKSGLAWQVEAGVKCNLFNRSLLKFGLNYGQKTLETSNSTSDKRNGLNAINFTAGFGIFFK